MGRELQRANHNQRLAAVRSGGIEIELCSGADEAAIRAIIEALRGC